MCYSPMLFRLQKYKKFESNSQQCSEAELKFCVVSTAKVQKIWEQFTTETNTYVFTTKLFRLQKYKKFESNSQLCRRRRQQIFRCFDCKSTKNLRAIHNTLSLLQYWYTLFRLQKYKKFESNSQRNDIVLRIEESCFDCKSTKNLRAIHNCFAQKVLENLVVSTAKVQKIWEQFTTKVQQSAIHRRCFDCKSTKNLRAIHNAYNYQTK